MATLTIGRLARKAGVHVETIRYYQRIGLIDEPPRPLNGFRVYRDDVVDRIRFIRRAQQLGFSLAEIADLLRIGEGGCDDVRSRAEAKCAQIEAQIRDLEALRASLQGLIERCRSSGDAGRCPIIETLAGCEDN